MSNDANHLPYQYHEPYSGPPPDYSRPAGQVVRWADRAQYHSQQMPAENRAPGGGARPTVRLLNATPDPLGSLAAIVGIYEGKVYSSLNAVDDDERRAALTAMQETVLDGPLEAVTFHFLIQGVTRAFTHQAVRNRFSFFAQESMRFAVVDNEQWVNRSAYPPSLAAPPVSNSEILRRAVDARDGNPAQQVTLSEHLTPEERDYALKRDAWDDAIITAQQAYQRLIDAGVPAEEARGLMPHSITTRYHWVVSLRTLLGEAGKRLCTQAQFEWRLVMAEVVKALREYVAWEPCEDSDEPEECNYFMPYRHEKRGNVWGHTPPDAWQFEAMADLLRPVCYQEGHCGFMAKFDRGCTIRERVNANAAHGRPSAEWHLPLIDESDPRTDTNGPGALRLIEAIKPQEWLADPAAARVAPGGKDG